MRPRSRTKIDTLLTPELREALQIKLLANDFRSYPALSNWLASKGHQISARAICKYAKGLGDDLKAVKLATQHATAIVEAPPDGAGAMNDKLTRQIQEKLFDILNEQDSIDIKKLKIGEMAKMIVMLGRASIDQKKFEQEMRAQVAGKVKKADHEIAQVAKQGGIPMEISQKIRNALLGIGV